MAVFTSVARCSPTGRTILAHILSLTGLMALLRVTRSIEKQFFAAPFGATFTNLRRTFGLQDFATSLSRR